MRNITKYLKKPWPYWVGGLLLGVMNVVLLAFAETRWQITSGFLLWGVGILQKFGLDLTSWEYFSHYPSYYEPIFSQGNLFLNQYTILNMAVVLGSLVATLLASQFKLKRIKSKKQFLTALIGGIMMGYGSRLALGCNIGTFFSGIPSFSLHAWVFGIFIFLGTGVGVKFLIRFIL